MKKNILFIPLLLVFCLFSCTSGDDDSSFKDSLGELSSEYSSDDGSGGDVPGEGTGQEQDPDHSGLITAGEWNDLVNWSFWNNLFNEKDYEGMPGYWQFYTNNRLSIEVMNNGSPVVNASVELLRDGNVVWTSRTDNFGYTELWLGLFQEEEVDDYSKLSVRINGKTQEETLVANEAGANKFTVDIANTNPTRVEVAFVVDATGSMSDELEFLKDDLGSVIDRVKEQDTKLDIYTSTVFYRDEGDDYVTKYSNFTSDLDQTIDYIFEQSANGGGDFPEAVHSALDVGLNELQWSDNSRTRLLFLLLDAPPHNEPEVMNSIRESVQAAAQKGVKIIPITASGIDKETEFLMRFMSIATNGTYVFITNHSGIGSEHLEASVGQYEVEFLNDLLVRLISKYSE